MSDAMDGYFCVHACKLGRGTKKWEGKERRELNTSARNGSMTFLGDKSCVGDGYMLEASYL